MKLDLDCVLDVLETIEAKAILDDNLEFEILTLDDFEENMPKWTIPQIAYTIIQLEEAGFINAGFTEEDNHIDDLIITRLTYDGHQFLEVLKPPKAKEVAKKFALEIGTTSLNIISNVASQVLTNLATSFLP